MIAEILICSLLLILFISLILGILPSAFPVLVVNRLIETYETQMNAKHIKFITNTVQENIFCWDISEKCKWLHPATSET